MTAIANRDDLVADIRDWSARRNFSDTLCHKFIAFAEERMDQDLRVHENSTRTYHYTDAEYQSLPSDFGELQRVHIFVGTNQFPLDYLSPIQLLRKWPNDVTGQVRNFTIVGQQLQYRPIPDDRYMVELAFWQKIQRLETANATNAILTNYPRLYLAASMMEAARYMKSQERLKEWTSVYEDALKRANDQEEKRVRSQPIRMQPRHSLTTRHSRGARYV